MSISDAPRKVKLDDGRTILVRGESPAMYWLDFRDVLTRPYVLAEPRFQEAVNQAEARSLQGG